MKKQAGKLESHHPKLPVSPSKPTTITHPKLPVPPWVVYRCHPCQLLHLATLSVSWQVKWNRKEVWMVSIFDRSKMVKPGEAKNMVLIYVNCFVWTTEWFWVKKKRLEPPPSQNPIGHLVDLLCILDDFGGCCSTTSQPPNMNHVDATKIWIIGWIESDSHWRLNHLTLELDCSWNRCNPPASLPLRHASLRFLRNDTIM